MVRVDFYEIAFKAENSTYSFELPAIPRIGEHLTVADGMGGFASQEVLDVQHVCFVGPNEFKGIRVLLASETSLVDYND